MRSERDPEMEGALDGLGVPVNWSESEDKLWAMVRDHNGYKLLRVACTCEPWAHWHADEQSYVVYLHHEDECRYRLLENNRRN